MRLTFLGTGTSFGVPVVGCECATCTSDDPRDRRYRHGAVLEAEGGTLLVDTPPELRLQLLRARVTSVDAVWITHTHADHVAGIDDVRIFSARRGAPLPAHIAREHADDLTARFRYIFDPAVVPPRGTTKPRIELVPFEAGETVRVVGRDLHPLALPHGPMTSYGFRTGGLGYVTDAKTLPAEVLAALEGVDVLVLNALWYGSPHPTHFNVEEAVEAAGRVGADRTYLVHLTHRVRHEELAAGLPGGIEPAFDGLTVEVE